MTNQEIRWQATETPIEGLNGQAYQYHWNGLTGIDSEHAYYDATNDAFLDYQDCKRVIPGYQV